MTVGNPNPKLEWANGNEECGSHSGTGHCCYLIKGHKGKKHSCDCGREWYGEYENTV